MHIHPNNSLLLAPLGVGREAALEIQARRAAEVRRKLSSASHVLEDAEDLFSPATGVERRSYDREAREGDEDAFGKLFSATA